MQSQPKFTHVSMLTLKSHVEWIQLKLHAKMLFIFCLVYKCTSSKKYQYTTYEKVPMVSFHLEHQLHTWYTFLLFSGNISFASWIRLYNKLNFFLTFAFFLNVNADSWQVLSKIFQFNFLIFRMNRIFSNIDFIKVSWNIVT